jgi:hypothetical protein
MDILWLNSVIVENYLNRTRTCPGCVSVAEACGPEPSNREFKASEGIILQKR